MNILDQYLTEFSEDTRVDEFNVKDVQMKLPGIKHKWVGRLMRSKIDINTLQRDKKTKIDELSKVLIAQSSIRVSEPIARRKVEEHQDVVTIDSKIRELEFLIEFCERAEKILSAMTYDIKNICDIMKLETQ